MTLPSLEISGEALTANAILFGRLLRRAGLPVDPAQTRMFTQVLGLLGFSRRRDVKAAARTVFVRRRDDLAIFDEAFELFWRRRGPGSDLAQRLRQADLTKLPGVAETLDWAAALTALGARRLEAGQVEETLGVLLKYQEDVAALKNGGARTLLAEVLAR